MKIEKANLVRQIKNLIIEAQPSLKEYPGSFYPLALALAKDSQYQMKREDFGCKAIGEIYQICKDNNINSEELSVLLTTNF